MLQSILFPEDAASPHQGTEAVLHWVSDHLLTLQDQAHLLVNDYWAFLRSHRPTVRHRERNVTLGLRLRPRDNGAFSIEWYEMGRMGRSKQPIAKRNVPKGRGPAYSIRALLRGQPEWIGAHVTDAEAVFAAMREHQATLLKILEAAAAYASLVTGRRVSGTELLSLYRREGTPPTASSKPDGPRVATGRNAHADRGGRHGHD